MEIKYRKDLNKLLPERPVVAELGCAEGYFSADMLQWPSGHLYMVDNWGHIENQTGDGNYEDKWHNENYVKAIARVEPFKNKYKVLRGITWEMAYKVPDNSLDLLYIDACHMYECVKKDLEAWYPKVKQGGIIAFHDYLNQAYGVHQAANEFANSIGKTITVIPENKDADAGAWIRV